MTQSRDPEWLRNFLEVVRTSKLATEAAARLGYAGPGTVRYHMKRLGIESPREWSLRPDARVTRQRHIPEVIIPTTVGRRWVAGLTQGEGCFQARSYTKYDVTYFNIDLSMADPEPVFRFSEYVGLSHPSKPVKNHDWKPNWHMNVAGLRALRVLQEIHPFLLGEKLKEAEKALAFFAPYGSHSGCFGNLDVWPTIEFPWRTKRRGASPYVSSGINALSNVLGILPPSERPEFHGLNLAEKWGVPKVIIPSQDDRAWTGGLVQGEGMIGSHYVRGTDSTTLIIEIRMTDPHPVFRFADFCGLPRPERARERPNRWQPIWRKNVAGIRALRVLNEIQP
ncbi:MAG: hypothetical protein ACRD6W_17760, partial [Nitrososphaerales archaeon]